MRCHDSLAFAPEKMRNDRLGESLPFLGICPSSQLVNQDQTFGIASRVIPMIFLMCEEKVERFSSMDCASPISQKIFL